MKHAYQWRLVYEGTTEDDKRPVRLLTYEDGSLRVETVQRGTEMMDVPASPGQIVVPLVYSDGDRIDIEAESVAALEAELRATGFSERDAKDICRHVAPLPKG
ncbi:hypothetical protein V9K97_17725 [Variovorax sp. CCNWLW186]|uniref:hypothetical protein n=1 Tax=Variovorax sp. CCNWLW186 TaxID=3127473 RepID=UPI00307701B7